MNRRVCACLGLILGCVTLICPVTGQLTPAPAITSTVADIPLAAQAAQSAAPFTGQIRAFIQGHVAELSGSDFAMQSVGRQKLLSFIGHIGTGTPSYYSVYAQEWTAAVTPLLAKSPAVGIRLNIAIVTDALAEIGQTADATPIVDQLLSDRDAAVVMWGMKAARPLIVIQLQSPDVTVITKSALAADIVSAVKKQGKSDLAGYITLDAYRALIPPKNNPNLLPAQVKPKIPVLIDYVLQILEFRVSQYAAGKVLMPGAEREISTFLSTDYLPTQQKKIVQLLVNLETYAGQRANLYDSKLDLSQLRETLMYVTSALKILCGPENANIVNPLLTWLTYIPPASSPAEIAAHTVTVYGTINNALHFVTQPPAIAPMEAPPASVDSPKPSTPGAPPVAPAPPRPSNPI